MRSTQINENDSGIRLDKYLSRVFKTMPKSLMYKYIRTKSIKINGKRAHENDILNVGDVLTFYISDEFFPSDGAEKTSALVSSRADIRVVYEDANILIADKESGLLVHSDDSGDPDTLINRIQSYLFSRGEYDPEKENSFAPALCNRIDRNTEGLVIAAKNALALRVMNGKIKNREIGKYYLCAVHGLVPDDSGTISGYIVKDTATNTVTFSARPTRSQEQKSAITKYNVIARSAKEKLTLLEVELVTGRTHQIRASFAFMGYPLLGDGKYAVNRDDRRRGFTSQALCAYRVVFDFKGEKTELDYLNGKEFRANEPSFIKLFGY